MFRWFCAAPALDLGYLLNVMHHKRPLDWEAVLKSDVPLKVVASCLDTLQPIILEDFTSAQVRKQFQYPATPNSSMPALPLCFLCVPSI